jgi:excisionase family DNA binding protein
LPLNRPSEQLQHLHNVNGEADVHRTDKRVVLTIEEAAERLGIGRTTMYALVMSGEVRSVTIGRLRRVPVQCLDEYVTALLTSVPTIAPAA